MPIPSSRTLHHRLAVFGRHGERDVPAAIGVLGGVVEQVGEHLHEARGIGVERQRPGRQRHRELLPLLDDHRAADLHRLQQERAELHAAPCGARSCPG